MRPPAALTRSTVSCPAVALVSQPTTKAPSSANRSADARPMLPPVPVIIQTLSLSRLDIQLESVSARCLQERHRIPILSVVNDQTIAERYESGICHFIWISISNKDRKSVV